MNGELLTLALLAGAATWAFRVLPTLARTERLTPGGWMERFLAATGPAAIATLFVSAVLPMVNQPLVPLALGVGGVVVAFLATRSVVVATLAGALAHGLAVWLSG
jgi:branched-subunit amino acid transport protein